MDENLVMFERKPNQPYPGYVYMTNKGKEHDDQRWILESTGNGYYKLKNKLSNKYLAIDYFHNFATADDAEYEMDHFKFDPKGDNKYIIGNNVGKGLRSRGADYTVRYAGRNTFTVKKCEENR